MVISAPSPVMNASDGDTTHFYVHALGRSPEGRILLHAPDRIDLPGEPSA